MPGKLKQMKSPLHELSKKMNAYISRFSNTNQQFELRDITEKFSLDALAICVFGFKTDSFTKDTSKFLKDANGFFHVVSEADDDSQLSNPKKLIRYFKEKWINLPFYIPNSIKQFLQNIKMNMFCHFLANDHARYLMQVVEKRKASGKTDNDLIGMMMEAIERPSKYEMENDADQYERDVNIHRNKPKEKLSRDSVISTALLMLSAGYDTTGTAMAFVLYELASNPDCQEKLLKEIKQAQNDVSKMPYMDAVIHESMRKHPLLANLERVCTEDHRFEGHDYEVKEGEMIRVSNIGICLDPDIFPEPQKFCPERFLKNDSNNMNRIPWSQYRNKNPFAFSLGQRNCLAMNFAMYEMKVGISTLIREFKLIRGDKTPEKIKWNPLSILGVAKGGLWIKCERR